MGDREQVEGEGIRAEEEAPAVYRDEGGALLLWLRPWIGEHLTRLEGKVKSYTRSLLE